MRAKSDQAASVEHMRNFPSHARNRRTARRHHRPDMHRATRSARERRRAVLVERRFFANNDSIVVTGLAWSHRGIGAGHGLECRRTLRVGGHDSHARCPAALRPACSCRGAQPHAAELACAQHVSLPRNQDKKRSTRRMARLSATFATALRTGRPTEASVRQSHTEAIRSRTAPSPAVVSAPNPLFLGRSAPA